MARHLDKFTKPFETSGIAFLLAEVITNGSGDMVDLGCRFLNPPAAALLGVGPETLRGRRLSQAFPAICLDDFFPLAEVAFSGSAATFSCTTVLGRVLNVTCYQPVYGLAACILEERRLSPPAQDPARALAEQLPGAAAVLEVSRQGVRNLSFNQRLCQLSGYSRKEFLQRSFGDFSTLVESDDWPDLLQDLLDSARDHHTVNHPFRLRRKSGEPLWMEFRAEPLPGEDGTCVFNAALLDVDDSTRSRAALQSALTELSVVKGQLSRLFDSLPGGFCAFRVAEDGHLTPIRVNHRLGEMLGCPPDKLLAKLSADPLWCVLPADRESLRAAATAGLTGQPPLRKTFRVQRSGGDPLWLAMEASERCEENGGTLIYVTLNDVSQQNAAEEELRFHSELCNLLLERSNTLSLDYHPASDTARLKFGNWNGKRLDQTIPHFLEALKTHPSLHPDDRKAVAAALKKVISRPGTISFTYRGSDDGQIWRWYQASCAGLLDGSGNICRVLGKAEDISRHMAAAERFRVFSARQKKLAHQALAAVHLDLSADQLLRAKGNNRHLMRVLFGNTAAESLNGIQGNLPQEAERQQFENRFQRQALLEAFQQGATHFSLLHNFSLGDGAEARCFTRLELAENPENHHLEAFCTIMNADSEPGE